MYSAHKDEYQKHTNILIYTLLVRLFSSNMYNYSLYTYVQCRLYTQHSQFCFFPSTRVNITLCDALPAALHLSGSGYRKFSEILQTFQRNVKVNWKNYREDSKYFGMNRHRNFRKILIKSWKYFAKILKIFVLIFAGSNSGIWQQIFLWFGKFWKKSHKCELV